MSKEKNIIFRDKFSIERFLFKVSDDLIGCSPLSILFLSKNKNISNIGALDEMINICVSLGGPSNDYLKLAGRIFNKKITVVSGVDYSALDPHSQIKKYVAGGNYHESMLDKYSLSDLNTVLAKIEFQIDEMLPISSLIALGKTYSTSFTEDLICEPVALSVLCFCLSTYAYKQKNRLLGVVDMYNAIMAGEISFDKKCVERLKKQLLPSVGLQCTVPVNSNGLGEIIKFVADASYCEKFGIYLGNICISENEVERLVSAIESCSSIKDKSSQIRYFVPYWYSQLEAIMNSKKSFAIYLDKNFYELLLADGHFCHPRSTEESEALTSGLMGNKYGPTTCLPSGDRSLINIRKWITDILDLAEKNKVDLHFVNIDHCLNHGVNRPNFGNIVLDFDMRSLPIRGGLVMDRVGASISLESLKGAENDKKKTIGVLLDSVDNFIDSVIKQDLDYPELNMYRGVDISVVSANLDSDDNKDLYVEAIEALKFYATQKSIALAKENGSFDFYKDEFYQKGISSLRSAKIDSGVKSHSKYDWDQLTADLLKHGIRNSFIVGGVVIGSSVANEQLKVVQKYSDYNQIKTIVFDNSVNVIRELIMSYKSGIRVAKIVSEK